MITAAVEKKFWALVDKSPGQGPNGDCWCWTGPLMEGYPRHRVIDGKRYRASHIALILDCRPMPALGLSALHSCDNRACVRADHLRWGTHLNNVEDAIARWNRRGRSFSPDEIRTIRASSDRQVDIARRYGVTSSCICNIRKRVTHKHVV